MLSTVGNRFLSNLTAEAAPVMRLALPSVALVLSIAPPAFPQSPCESADFHWPTVWMEGSQCGFSVALDRDRLAIGQIRGPFSKSTGDGPGKVYLLRSPGGSWIEDGVVQASDATLDDDQFGYSVALDGDRLLVGAIETGPYDAKGAAYVYERQGDGVWVETAKLVPDEPQAFSIGWSVALEGDRAVIGAKGASTLGLGWGRVFVYELVGEQWVLQQQLLPSFSAAGDAFGQSVALQGDRIVVGASYGFTAVHPNHGWVFVFENQGGVWAETTALVGDDTVDSDNFGGSVTLSGDTIVVGAKNHDAPNPGNGGAAYVFERSEGVWTQTAKLWGDPQFLSYFGRSVDLEGDRLAVGAHRDSELAPNAGKVYLFERSGSEWSLVAKLHGSKLANGNTFGDDVDLEGDTILVGAANVVASPPGPGAAYLFSLQPGPHLIGDVTAVSLAAGGEQTLHVGGCPVHAGDLYFVAGSATGTVPGFSAFGLPVPLNPDVYFLHTVNHAGAPPLSGAFGVLDATGCADATFALPPGTSQSLAGLVMHHAYAVLDAATLDVETVSAAVPVALVP